MSIDRALSFARRWKQLLYIYIHTIVGNHNILFYVKQMKEIVRRNNCVGSFLLFVVECNEKLGPKIMLFGKTIETTKRADRIGT